MSLWLFGGNIRSQCLLDWSTDDWVRIISSAILTVYLLLIVWKGVNEVKEAGNGHFDKKQRVNTKIRLKWTGFEPPTSLRREWHLLMNFITYLKLKIKKCLIKIVTAVPCKIPRYWVKYGCINYQALKEKVSNSERLSILSASVKSR